MNIGPIILAAGGTGGHLYPAIALGRELQRRGRDVVLATDSRGRSLAGIGDLPVARVRAAGPRGGLMAKARAARSILRGVFDARRLFRDRRPGLVVGFGGYPSVPTLVAARLGGIPTILHEQNAYAGLVNRRLAGRARAVAGGFPKTAGLPGQVTRRTVHTGNPVRPDIAARAGTPPLPWQETGPIGILITGGSQGARILGDVVPPALAALPEPLRHRLRVAQQCRSEDLERVAAAYREFGLRPELAAFFSDMPERLANCHLAIMRAGASTIAELTVVGRPAILIPYAFATDDHQSFNARAVADAGAGWLVPQDRFDADHLAGRLAEILDPHILAAAAGRAAAMGRPDAATRLADLVLAQCAGAEMAA